MKWLILLASGFVMASSIWAAPQYRDFKDSQGRTIRAKVLKFNAHTEMVTIRREGMRASKVPLNIFSEADQSYIQNIGKPTASKSVEPKKEANPTTEPLSEEEIEAIAEQYVEAVNKENIDALDKLFSTPDWDRKEYKHFLSTSGNSVKVRKINGNNIYIVRSGYMEGQLGVSGWLQLTPAGKIKYCPLFAPHPVEKATSTLHAIFPHIEYLRDGMGKGIWIRELKDTGIPTFGLHQEMTKSEWRDALDKTRDWLIENGGEYDNSEPKLFLPEKQMKLVKQTLKSL